MECHWPLLRRYAQHLRACRHETYCEEGKAAFKHAKIKLKKLGTTTNNLEILAFWPNFTIQPTLLQITTAVSVVL